MCTLSVLKMKKKNEMCTRLQRLLLAVKGSKRDKPIVTRFHARLFDISASPEVMQSIYLAL